MSGARNLEKTWGGKWSSIFNITTYRQALTNYIEAIRRLPLDEKSKEDVLGGTAARLLKL